MLFHELQELFPHTFGNGSDELYDTTSVAGYTFYGVAPLGTSQSAASWWIMAARLSVDGALVATRYYGPNQVWANRSLLSLP